MRAGLGVALFAALVPGMPLAGQPAARERAQDQAATIARAIGELRAGSPLALAVLQRTQEASAEALVRELHVSLQAGESASVAQVLAAISALSTGTREVVQGLLAALEPASDHVRQQILHTLGDLAGIATTCEELGRWLTDLPASSLDKLRPTLVRAFAARDSGSVATHAFTAATRAHSRWQRRSDADAAALLALLRDEDLDVAELAAERLRTLARSSPAVRDALEVLATCESMTDTASISHWPSTGRTRVSDLRSLKCTAQLAAALALVQLHPESAQLRTAHRLILEQGRPDQQLASLLALRADADEAPLDVSAIVALLGREKHRLLRREAVITLGTLGARAATAAPALRELADGEDQELSVLALAALQAVGQR